MMVQQFDTVNNKKNVTEGATASVFIPNDLGGIDHCGVLEVKQWTTYRPWACHTLYPKCMFTIHRLKLRLVAWDWEHME